MLNLFVENTHLREHQHKTTLITFKLSSLAGTVAIPKLFTVKAVGDLLLPPSSESALTFLEGLAKACSLEKASCQGGHDWKYASHGSYYFDSQLTIEVIVTKSCPRWPFRFTRSTKMSAKGHLKTSFRM